MSRVKETDEIQRLRSANKLRSTSEGREAVSAATVVGLWLVIPFAIGAFAQLALGIVWLTFPLGESGDYPSFWVRVPTTILLLVGYWGLLAVRTGRSGAWSLWVLLPVVALVPTFVIARDAAAGASARVGGSDYDAEGVDQAVPDPSDKVDI